MLYPHTAPYVTIHVAERNGAAVKAFRAKWAGVSMLLKLFLLYFIQFVSTKKFGVAR